MRVKLDENLPLQLSRLFTESGHDAVTVLDEGIGGATDAEIASVCLAEERVLVTQDVDFADIRMYPPGDYPGIVVFRLASQTRDLILEVGARLIETLAGGGMRKCSAVEDFARRGSCPPLGSGWGGYRLGT